MVLSSLSAAALEHFLRKNSIVVAATSGTLEKFLNDFFGIVKHGDFLFIALLIINFTICFRALFIAVKMFRRYTTSNYENLELFLGLSILFTFAVPLVLKMYFDLALWRYFLISFIIPIVWISVISAKYAVTKNKEYIIFVLSAILILACTIIFYTKGF